MNHDAPPKIVGTFALRVPRARSDADGMDESVATVGIDTEGQLWGLVETNGHAFDRWISFQPPLYFADPDEEHLDQIGGTWWEVEDDDEEPVAGRPDPPIKAPDSE